MVFRETGPKRAAGRAFCSDLPPMPPEKGGQNPEKHRCPWYFRTPRKKLRIFLRSQRIFFGTLAVKALTWPLFAFSADFLRDLRG